VVRKVLKIEARQVGTASVNNKNKKLPLPPGTDDLPPSTSSNADLAANKPVVLVRGSHTVFLKAITDPPNQVVNWQVVPNQSSGQPPDIDPKQSFGDFEAQLSTSSTGSFSVKAELDASVVIWNLVLVEVTVDPKSKVVALQTGLQDFNVSISGPDGLKGSGSLPGEFDKLSSTGVASGKFEFGKHAWSSEVRVTLKGGGPSGDLGCDQVVVQFLQNILSDTTVAEYETKIGFHDFANPARFLDVPGGSPPDYDGPVIAVGVDRKTFRPVKQSPFMFTEGMFQLVKNDPTSRVMRVGDSPASGCITRENNEKLKRIRGNVEFRTAVVSFSKHNINSMVAHADAIWRVDYTGDVSVSNVGEWSKTTANVQRVQDWQDIKSSSGNPGTDAANALLEVFPPRAVEKTGEPRKVISKP
jgi:hypothetical protein